MFSRFSIKLDKRSAFNLPQICVILEEAYVPKPMIEIIKKTFDFKSFTIGGAIGVSAFAQLNDHNF